MTELEREVLEIINCEIEGCYIGKLEVKEDRFYKNYTCSQNKCDKGVMVNIELALHLYLNADYEPIVMSYLSQRLYNWKKWHDNEDSPGWEYEDKFYKRAKTEFKNFIKEEFKNRILQQVDYYKLTLQLPSIDCSNE